MHPTAPPPYHPLSAPTPLHPRCLTNLNAETASIHSLAPSYHSQAPSYHSIFPSSSPATTLRGGSSSNGMRNASTGRDGYAPGFGGNRFGSDRSELKLSHINQFRIPTWSNATVNNPAARHYRRVADRRAKGMISPTKGTARVENVDEVMDTLARLVFAAASSPADEIGESGKKIKEGEEEGGEAEMEAEELKLRLLEDSWLVGEEAAREAKEERLAREKEAATVARKVKNRRLAIEREARETEEGMDVLVREDERWDWMLSQMQDWDHNEKNWARYKDILARRSKNGKMGFGKWSK